MLQICLKNRETVSRWYDDWKTQVTLPCSSCLVFDMYDSSGSSTQTCRHICRLVSQGSIRLISSFRLNKDQTYNNASADENYSECIHHRRTSSPVCWSVIGSSAVLSRLYNMLIGKRFVSYVCVFLHQPTLDNDKRCRGCTLDVRLCSPWCRLINVLRRKTQDVWFPSPSIIFLLVFFF